MGLLTTKKSQIMIPEIFMKGKSSLLKFAMTAYLAVNTVCHKYRKESISEELINLAQDENR